MKAGDIDWERLDRFMRGAGSRDEQRELERWVASNSGLLDVAAAMRHEGRPGRFDATAAWERFRLRATALARSPV